MGQQILSNVKIWIAQYEMSGKVNALALNNAPDMLDNTTLNMLAKSRKKGMAVVTAQLNGFWDSEADAIFDDFTTSGVPVIFDPSPGIEGDVAYGFKSHSVDYNFGGSVGDLLKFQVKMEAEGTDLIRGTILFNNTKIATESGSAFAFNALASSANQVYAGLIVTSCSAADTLVVSIESDATSAFSSPTTVLTFAEKSAVGYEWKTAVGPNTDTWYRANYIINGATPSFTFLVFMGTK